MQVSHMLYGLMIAGFVAASGHDTLAQSRQAGGPTCEVIGGLLLIDLPQGSIILRPDEWESSSDELGTQYEFNVGGVGDYCFKYTDGRTVARIGSQRYR